MRRTTGAVATATLVGVSALGISALPGSAAPEGATSESRTDTRHTKKWVLRETAGQSVGRSFASTDVIRSRTTGRIVGYDSGVSKLFESQNRVVWQVAFALDGGIIVARLNVDLSEERHRGRILSGSGKYRDIEGTMTSRQLQNGRTWVTLHYQL